MHVDRNTYRNAMARCSAAVSVVTTDGPAGRFGFTCTAICSVTDEPATLLVCIHKDSRSNAAFKTNLVLCVNLLNRDQEDISALFAGQGGEDMAERFKRVRWSTRRTGAPVFEHAVASLDCSIAEIKEFGTHTILFARVYSAEVRPEQQPLMYFNRGYHGLEYIPPGSSASATGSDRH